MTSPGEIPMWQRACDRLASRLPMPINHVVPVKHVEPAAVVCRRRRIVA